MHLLKSIDFSFEKSGMILCLNLTVGISTYPERYSITAATAALRILLALTSPT
jgi:hypothetical protein